MMCVAARAGCSRKIDVPVAPVGLSVTVNGDQIGGVYPDLLRAMSAAGGCDFVYSVVPRARLQVKFDSGDADMLLPASRTAQRDKLGLFIPLIMVRSALISLDESNLNLHTARQLLEHRDIRIGIVRGYEFGSGYQKLVADLNAQARVVQVVDADDVARMLDAHMIDATVMVPTILYGASQTDPRVQHLGNRLRVHNLDELDWNESGVYLSYARLSESDRNVLRDLFESVYRSGEMWKTFQRYYPATIINGNVKARGSVSP